MTTAANATSSTSLAPVLPPAVEKNSDSSTIAAKSATVAAAIAVCPTSVSTCPASLSTGTIRPSDVADKAMASSSGRPTQPAAAKPAPAARPSTRVTA